MEMRVAEAQMLFHGESSNRDYTIVTIHVCGVLLLQVLRFFLTCITTCALEHLAAFEDLYKDFGVWGCSLSSVAYLAQAAFSVTGQHWDEIVPKLGLLKLVTRVYKVL